MAEDMSTLDGLMEEIAARGPKLASPGGWFSSSGDCCFWHNEDVPYSRRRVDELLTVYRAEDDGRIVGVQIKGIKKLPRHDIMRILVHKTEEVVIVELLLLTYKRQRGEDPDRDKAYFDACESMVGKRISARELQATLG